MNNLLSMALRIVRLPVAITARLRVALAMILLGVVLTGAVAILQAQRILHAYKQLHDTALPLLALSEDSRQTIDLFAATLSSVATQSIDDRLTASPGNISAQTDHVRQSLRALSRYDIPPALLDSLDTRLAMTEATTLKILRDRTAFSKVEDSTTQLLISFVQLKNDISIIINGLRISGHPRPGPDNKAGVSGISPQPQKNSDPNVQNNHLLLNQIDSHFDKLFSLSLSHDLTIQNEENWSDSSILPGYLDKIRVLSLRLQASPQRKLLLQKVEETGTLLFESNGLLAKRMKQSQMETAFEARRDFQLPLVHEVSAMSSDLVTRSFSIVDNASRELNSAIRQLIWMQAGSLSLGMITILLTNYFIVERQFNRRIKDLAISVAAIAKGELNHRVTIAGADEIAHVAKGLVIFKENAQELRRSNGELEKFAYVAAHDLRSPLRAIQDLSTWTLEDEDSTLSPEGHEFQLLLQERVGRLNRLLNDLLIYARLGKMRPGAQEVDLAGIVREHAQQIDPEGRFHTSYVGVSGSIWARVTPIEQSIANLISNAVKHHDRETGQISVTARRTDNILTIDVADDGPGVPKEYQDRVFGLFQTLRPRDEVEGSGLGLAIVKKLIETELGTVILISDPQQRRGTVFRITLPMAPNMQNDNGPNLPSAA